MLIVEEINLRFFKLIIKVQEIKQSQNLWKPNQGIIWSIMILNFIL